MLEDIGLRGTHSPMYTRNTCTPCTRVRVRVRVRIRGPHAHLAPGLELELLTSM